MFLQFPEPVLGRTRCTRKDSVRVTEFFGIGIRLYVRVKGLPMPGKTSPVLPTAILLDGSGQAPQIDRVSVDDLMSLVPDRGRTPVQIGAILILDVGAGLDPAQLLATLERRLPAVPRLRQNLVHLPLFSGRPIWVDDPQFKITDHVSVMRCPSPAGVGAVLDVAAGLLMTPLPRDRALWAAALVTDVGAGQAALILRFHHVLADGVAGLAILAGLADGVGEPQDSPFPRPRPTHPQLMADAARDGLRAARGFPAALVGFARALSQFRPALVSRLPSSSLNRPTGPLRRFATVSCDLAEIHGVAHSSGATVNDVVLSSVTGALHRLLAERQESVETFVLSVPVSFRRSTTGQHLGNRSGVTPLHLPGVGEPFGRLRAVARITAAAKLNPPGALNALLGPGFRLLAWTGLYQRFIDHQHSVHTFVTNLRGPETTLSLGGHPVVSVIPLAVASGNITVSFAVLSYAGQLTVTLIADPETCPDLSRLRDLLQGELEVLAGSVRPPGQMTVRDREAQGS